MKILFVNRYAARLGGVEYYVNALSSRLRDAGHRTGMVHWDESAPAERFDTYYRVPSLWDGELALTSGTRKLLDGILREFSPDIVYLHNIENGKAIDHLAYKARTVRYVHGYKTVDPDGKMLLKEPLEANSFPLSPTCFIRAYTRKSMPRAPVKALRSYLRARSSLKATNRLEKILVASGHMKRTMIMNGTRPENIHVLPYFVDYEDLAPPGAPGERRILFCGRIAEGKGLDVLMDVLSMAGGNFTLDVVGTGPMEDACRKKARELGLENKVRFLGWKEHGELPRLYKEALFLVLPSVWPEPFGISGIEAAFFARPAVAFDVGGISDWLVDGNTGFLVEPYDKKKMAEKISYFLNDPEETLKMGQRARGSALEKYKPQTHLEELFKVFAA